MKPQKNRARDLGFYILVMVILLAVIYSMVAPTQSEQVIYSDVVELFRNEQVESFYIEGSNIVLTLKDAAEGDPPVTYQLYDVSLFWYDMSDLIMQQQEEGIISGYNLDVGWVAPWWFSFVFYMLIIAAMFGLWYALMNKSSGGGAPGVGKFGKARTRLGSEEQKKVTFRDVAGCEEEKAELEEVVNFLKNPKAYTDMGARIPKGVLLVGPPGTGKTLIAKAVAGEAGVQFLSISGSDFVELYVGVGASRVRDLFDQAKKDCPAIVFIDEIDAVGRQRGAGLGGGHDEREQTLNQLLVEMDGFSANEGVIVLAATNRVDILDPALLRPGRFDRQVYVGYPDMKGREAILKVHCRKKPLAEDVDLHEVAKSTGGFTGADLENLMNEAALLAARKDQPFITLSDIQESVIKVIAGPEKRSKTVIERERKLTAYHEAGHAVVGHALETADPVHQITIVPRGGAGGMTISLPQEDRGYRSRLELTEQLSSLLGGRMAEELVLGDISTGAGSDIRRATDIARNMVTRYGMSQRLGNVVFDSGHDEVFIGRSMAQTKNYSEEVAAIIDEEVKSLIDNAYTRCRQILTEQRSALELVARYLLEFETMDGATFQRVFDDPAAVEAMLAPAQEGAEDKAPEALPEETDGQE